MGWGSAAGMGTFQSRQSGDCTDAAAGPGRWQWTWSCEVYIVHTRYLKKGSGPGPEAALQIPCPGPWQHEPSRPHTTQLAPLQGGPFSCRPCPIPCLPPHPVLHTQYFEVA